MQNDTEYKELPAEVINALSSGRKIEAIKLLRGEWNIDLKKAKNIVDQHIASDPLLKDRLRREGNNGCFPLIVILIFIAGGFYCALYRRVCVFYMNNLRRASFPCLFYLLTR